MEGPRQVWTWSRIDGSVTQHMVRPSKIADCWIEEYAGGWHLRPAYSLCDSHDEAVRQARAQFQKIAVRAQSVLDKLK